MLCINNLSTDVYFNLAAEEYLLKNLEEDVFMLSRNEPSVVVGKYQHAKAEINFDFVEQKNIKIARRISGGGAVFQDLGNFNLTFIQNNSNPNFNKKTEQIIDFLSMLGLNAELNKQRGIFIDGLKISGNAQYIFKNRSLYHATLLYRSNLDCLAVALNPSSLPQDNLQKIYVKSVKSPVANIADHIENPLEITAFRNVIFNYFLENKPNNTTRKFTEKEISTINRLKTSKYETLDWIFNR